PYLSTQVKLAADCSVPGLPVNFGHFGHSHIGRERPAFGPWLPSTAVKPLGGCPFSTHFSSALRLSNFALNEPKPWAKPGIMEYRMKLARLDCPNFAICFV